MNILSWKRDLQDLSRLKDIVTILVEEGFHAHLAKADLAKHARIHKRLQHGRKRHKMTPERAKHILERLGPTFVKLGQVLSLRPDLVPQEYCEAFKQLQDDVPAVPFSEIHAVLQEELDMRPEDVFRKISHTSIAAASVAQVHAAELHDGTHVVLKVQRPGVKEKMERDIDIMAYLAGKIDKHYPLLHARDMIAEFKEYTEREIDFTFEARHLRIFGEFFSDDAEILIPKPYDEHTTGKLLVMERVEGIPVSNLNELAKRKINCVKLARIAERAFMKQAFQLGMFHADPHPGNLMAVKSGKGLQFVFLDFGIVGILDDHMQKKFLHLLLSMTQSDAEGISTTIISIGTPGPRFSESAFRRAIDTLMRERTDKDSLTTFVYEIILKSLDNDLSLPTDIITAAKAFVTIEGAAKWLYPKINILEELKPFLPEAFGKHYGPGEIKKELLRELPGMEDSMRSLPGAVENLIRKMQDGNLALRLSKEDVSAVARNYDLEADKRNYIFLAGTIFIGSGILAGFSPDLSFFGRPLYWWGFLASFLSFLVFLYTSMKIHKYYERG